MTHTCSVSWRYKARSLSVWQLVCSWCHMKASIVVKSLLCSVTQVYPPCEMTRVIESLHVWVHQPIDTLQSSCLDTKTRGKTWKPDPLLTSAESSCRHHWICGSASSSFSCRKCLNSCSVWGIQQPVLSLMTCSTWFPQTNLWSRNFLLLQLQVINSFTVFTSGNEQCF